MPLRLDVSQESLLRHIKLSLGWPKSCVELDEEQLETAAFDAALWIAVHLGQERRTTISVSSGVSEYSLPDDCEHVLDVAFPTRWGGTLPLALNLEGLEDLYYAQFYRFGSRSGGFNSNVMQHLQYIDMMQRTLSSDADHTWEQYQRKLIVMPPTMSGTAIVWYLSNQIDFDRLTLPQKLLMRRYAVARAMFMLGVVRSKFSEVPAAGGRVSLNGSELIASAEGELATLDEKIKNLSPPLGFTTG